MAKKITSSRSVHIEKAAAAADRRPHAVSHGSARRHRCRRVCGLKLATRVCRCSSTHGSSGRFKTAPNARISGNGEQRAPPPKKKSQRAARRRQKLWVRADGRARTGSSAVEWQQKSRTTRRRTRSGGDGGGGKQDNNANGGGGGGGDGNGGVGGNDKR